MGIKSGANHGSLHEVAASSFSLASIVRHGLRVVVLFGIDARSCYYPGLSACEPLGGALYQTQVSLQPTVSHSSLRFDLP